MSTGVHECMSTGVPERIVFFHMNALGDFVFSLPAVRAVRRRFPAASITSVVRPNLVPLLEGSSVVDDVLPRAKGLAGTLALVAQLRRKEFDLAVAFSRSPGVVSLVRLTGAAGRVGFLGASFDWLLTDRVTWTRPASVANNLRLVAAVGADGENGDPRGLVRVTPSGSARATALLAEHGVHGEFVLAAPEASARRGIKEWPAEYWDQTLRQLAEGRSIVVVGLPRQGDPVRPYVDLRGRTDTGTLAALCARADLCVGVDSGVLHLAAAMGTPVVGIYGPTDWRATGPPARAPHRIVRSEMECSPCLRNRCLWTGDAERRCLTATTPDAVVRAANELLGGSAA
jgi:ADP-heptose:LPS heptosyltransferase